MNYYNEFDPKAAAWLRELIRCGLIPDGHVDERSIADVRPNDLRGFVQHHFFAGIGGWPIALARAGVPSDYPVRTASCPCQPFSGAGNQLAERDPRHLWPVARDLFAQLEPAITFGEQVASKLGREWLAGVRTDLEALGYEVGATDLCAAGVGAPHIRQRLYWVAYANSGWDGSECSRSNQRAISTGNGKDFGGLAYGPEHGRGEGPRHEGELSGARCVGHRPAEHGGPCGLGDTDGTGSLSRGQTAASYGHRSSSLADGCALGLGHTQQPRLEGLAGHGDGRHEPGRLDARSAGPAAAPSPVDAWGRFDIVHCTDGKARRIEPGTFPLVARLSGELGRVRDPGLPLNALANAEGRVMRLKGYGNAIVPDQAAEFIIASIEAIES